MAKRGVTYEQLETAFKHGNFKPLYLFYGEEKFLMDKLQSLLIENALAPHERDFNLDLIYGAEVDGNKVRALCTSFPMMAARRVVIVRDFDKMKGNQVFKEYANHPNPTTVVLLICSGKPKMTSHPYRALREKGTGVEFKRLKPRQIPGWMKSYALSKGYKFEGGAEQLLADYVGSGLLAASLEIDKLIAFAGERKQITRNDIVEATGQTRECNVFELQKKIGEADYEGAMRIAERLLQQASNPRGEALMIAAVLSAYFTKLFKLTNCQELGMSERAMAENAGISPYFVKEYLVGIRRLGPKTIENAFKTLLSVDYELKGGSTRNEKLIIQLMIRALTSGHHPRAFA